LTLESSGTFHALLLFNKIKNLNELELNREYTRKFYKYSKIIIKLIIPLSRLSKYSAIIVYSLVVIICYLDQNGNYSLFTTIFWCLLMNTCISTFIPLIYCAIFIVCILTLYLKFRFRQIYESINFHSKYGNHF